MTSHRAVGAISTLAIEQGAFDALVKETIAFAIEYADNCQVPDGYASDCGYPDVDWLSDWGAFLADSVLREFEVRGLRVILDRSAEWEARRAADPFAAPHQAKTNG